MYKLTQTMTKRDKVRIHMLIIYLIIAGILLLSTIS
jgi:hypothetical protein